MSYEKEYPTSRKSFVRQLLAASSFQVPNRIGQKTLFIASLKDRFVNHSCSAALAQHYNQPVSLHLFAGHDLPLDDPDWLIHEIINFNKKA